MEDLVDQLRRRLLRRGRKEVGRRQSVKGGRELEVVGKLPEGEMRRGE